MRASSSVGNSVMPLRVSSQASQLAAVLSAVFLACKIV
jgi:hypothetical protein